MSLLLSIPGGPGPPHCPALLLENGDLFLLEDGSHLLLLGEPIGPALLLEDGFYLLLEDCSHLLLEGGDGCIPYEPIGPSLLLEDGFYLLLEDCSHLLLEDGTPTPPPPNDSHYGKANKKGRPLINEAMEEEDWELIIGLWLNIR